MNSPRIGTMPPGLPGRIAGGEADRRGQGLGVQGSQCRSGRAAAGRRLPCAREWDSIAFVQTDQRCWFGFGVAIWHTVFFVW